MADLLKLPRVLDGSEIRGFGHFQPERAVSNEELELLMDTSDEWIRRRTGIVTRHLAATDETVDLMAAGAAAAAIDDAGVDRSSIDLVIVATTTADVRCPNTAGRVAAVLGLDSPAIIDVNTACSGFAYSLALADQSIRTGSATNAVVIGADKLSAVTDWSDRTTAILTADGAGAAVISGCDESRIGPVAWGSCQGLVDAVKIGPPSNMFVQQGRDVYRWAITEAAVQAQRAIDISGLQNADIEVLACHQANLRIIEPLAEQLGLADKIILADIADSGNTSAASIPLGLSKWWRSGRIPRDVPALFFGFGGGFTFAGLVAMTPRQAGGSTTAP